VLLQILFLCTILLDKQKKSNHIKLQRLYHLFETQRRKALWRNVYIQYKILHPSKFTDTFVYLTTGIHVWHDVRHSRVRRHSNLPRVSVQAFKFDILQLILRFCLPYLPIGRAVYGSVSQPPGSGPVPGPGINYTGPREVNIL
jgi:hypothetical protein